MNEQIDEAYKTFDIQMMTVLEIIAYFEWLNFRDEIGHPLTMSTAFMQLVDAAKNSTK